MLNISDNNKTRLKREYSDSFLINTGVKRADSFFSLAIDIIVLEGPQQKARLRIKKFIDILA